jgi:Tol biopolymer transport system component
MSETKLDGSGLRELRYGTAGALYGPSKQLDWSADGVRWVFVRGGLNLYEDPATLYTSKARSATETKVGTLEGWNPRWSPDGTAIAYIGEHGIFVTDVDGRRNDRVYEISPVHGIDW